MADLIVRSALQRRESRGLHFTLDHPQQSAHAQDTILFPGGLDDLNVMEQPLTTEARGAACPIIRVACCLAWRNAKFASTTPGKDLATHFIGERPLRARAGNTKADGPASARIAAVE